MKKRQGLRLRRIGNKHIIIDAGQPMVNLTDVYMLNDTAAFLWEQAGDGELYADELAARLSEAFGVDLDTALRDTRHQLAEWEEYGLLTR